MLKEDIKMAQQIISGSKSNLNYDYFHDSSFVYRFTNEEISKFYNYLKNRERVLTVTASGDQILNHILAGSSHIDTFDISRFPKYFFELKNAGIKALKYNDYISFFCNDNIVDEQKDCYYSEIRKMLENNSKIFWDSLFMYFDFSDIFSSTLFSSAPFSSLDLEDKNPYLQEDNYYILKEKINDVLINHYTMDVSDALKLGEYDLIYLSNIISYMDHAKYKQMIKSARLRNDGVLLSYLFSFIDRPQKYFYSDEEFELLDFSTKDNNGSGVLIYKKSTKI